MAVLIIITDCGGGGGGGGKGPWFYQLGVPAVRGY